MIDPMIHRLLEQVIDSPIKLQLVLLFHEHATLVATPTQVGERIYRDIWSTREALRELAEDGVLGVTSGRDEPVYRYQPATERVEAIDRLLKCYNEPLTRDGLQCALREIASNAPFRRALRGGVAFESINL
ncbi:MAG TPA: hypothetical protein PKA05_13965 [Roseiflexaceae bacterium]|nr:hypothetical protein [Roseiflexaceae bacterium]HMP41483.1 hypothetical protein [Roseiflexaceae bacterium]